MIKTNYIRLYTDITVYNRFLYGFDSELFINQKDEIF